MREYFQVKRVGSASGRIFDKGGIYEAYEEERDQYVKNKLDVWTKYGAGTTLYPFYELFERVTPLSEDEQFVLKLKGMSTSGT